MKTIEEAVELPAVAVQPLVHPLDLPPARRAFITSWWLSLLTLPPVFFGIAAVLWSVSTTI